jgi:sulfide:quinone oxidoreductase
MENKTPIARYRGYSACPIPTAYGKLMLANLIIQILKNDFSYQSKPNWAMWMLKTKVLPWLYWNKILKGTA